MGMESRRKYTPWRDKQTLEYLKNERDLTNKKIANLLGCSVNPISRWCRKLDVYSGNYSTNGVYHREDKQDGHYQIHIRNGEVVPEHSLVAIAGGADPHQVFANDTNVHHKNKMKLDNRPENLIVVEEKEHAFIHMNEEWARREGLLSENTAPYK